LLLAVTGTRTGETWTRYGRVVRRVNQPIQFWSSVVTCYFVGISFIAYFLYKVYELSELR